MYFNFFCFPFLILDTQIVFRDEFDGLSILDVDGKLNRRTLVPNTTFTNLNAMYHGVSANQKYVWLAHDYYKVSFNTFFEIFLLDQNSKLFKLICISFFLCHQFLIYRTFVTHSGLGIQCTKSTQGKKTFPLPLIIIIVFVSRTL